MLKIMTSAVPALILSLAAFSAGAAQLPASLMDKDNPGQEYWCQGNDINTSMCSLTGVSDDHKFALIQAGINVPYDGGDCKGDVKAGFVRSAEDNALYVKIVRGSKTLRLYKVQTGY